MGIFFQLLLLQVAVILCLLVPRSLAFNEVNSGIMTRIRPNRNMIKMKSLPSSLRSLKLQMSNSIDETPTSYRPAWWKKAAISAGLFLSTAMMTPNIEPAFAADTAKVGLCLLKSCQKELAQCLLNPKCFANVVCLNTCNNRKDEAACQINCGNYFENDVVGVFNNCAVSQKKCVPQKQNEGEYPLPDVNSMVKKFDTSIWNGRWYISAGLNKLFDIFPCQVHFFTSPAPDKFYAKINWRIAEPDGEEFTRNALQNFVQDPKNPAHFINHDNEYLHYKDDWYIIDYEPDDFVLVYYQGSNDAWDGYGGAFLYSRAPTVRPELIPRLEKAVSSMNLKYKWSDFTLTDNSCPLQTKSPTLLREEYAKRLLLTEEEQLQQQLTGLRNAAVSTIVADEKEFLKSFSVLEKEVEKFETEIAKDASKVVSRVENEIVKDAKEIAKDVMDVEKSVERSFKSK